MYVFSSSVYLDKFRTRLIDWIDTSKKKFSALYGYEISSDEFFACMLYSKIEKRGFMIALGGEIITCQSKVKLSGAIVT